MNDINPNDIERIEIFEGRRCRDAVRNGSRGRRDSDLHEERTQRQTAVDAPGRPRLRALAAVRSRSEHRAAGRHDPQDLSRQLPVALRRPPAERRVARRRIVELPVHRSVASQRTAAQLLASPSPAAARRSSYFASGATNNDDGVLPSDNEKKKIVRGNFSFTPISNLLFAWNTSFTKDEISNTAAGNNAHGLTLNAFRRDRNYASDDRPEVVEKLLNQQINSSINHLVTGSTITWSPTLALSNRFTVGFDRAEIENRSLRPFGFVSAPQGILSDRFNCLSEPDGRLRRQLRTPVLQEHARHDLVGRPGRDDRPPRDVGVRRKLPRPRQSRSWPARARRSASRRASAS